LLIDNKSNMRKIFPYLYLPQARHETY